MFNDSIYKLIADSNPQINIRRDDPIEWNLSKAVKHWAKGIVEVEAGEGKAINPVQDGISYLFTGSLNGCQACSIIAKGKNGNPIAIMTHYPPDALNANIAEIKRLIRQNKCFIDETAAPVVALVLPNDEVDDTEPVAETLKSAIKEEFTNGIEMREIRYEYDRNPDYGKKTYEYIIEFPKNKGGLIKYQLHGKHFGDFGKMQP